MMKRTGKMYTGIILAVAMAFTLVMPANAEELEAATDEEEQETAIDEISVKDSDEIAGGIVTYDDNGSGDDDTDTGDDDGNTGDTGDTGDSGDTGNTGDENPDDTDPDDTEPDEIDEPVPNNYTGFWKNPDDGNWYYYTKSVIDTSKTDVMQGTVDGESGWWNVVKGKVTKGETVAKNSSGWWYINSDGMVDFSYNGFAKNSNGSWYCENGKVTFSKTSVLQDSTGAIGAKGNWYYVVDSKVQTSYTGLANNSYGWWYIKNGKVDFSHNGVDQNENGWWYVLGGKVQFGYTGVVDYTNAYGWWYVKNGKVDFSANTVAQNKYGWWYVLGGKVQFSYTGLGNYGNANGWWYIKNGKADFSHNGVDKNNYGWWYVTGGKVQFGYTGVANYSNANGWWYIKNGKVDFSANTVAQNKYGWWYVLGGKVQFGYTGVADYSNAYGWWYINKGEADFSYTGIARNKIGTWYVENGKVKFINGTVVGDDGNTYYFSSSKGMATGWAKLSDGYYYFDRTSGAMKKNTTVDGIKLDSSGKASANSDQIYKIQTMIKARDVYLSITSPSDSQSAQLKKCFDWVLAHPYKRYHIMPEMQQKYPNTWTCIYADDEFNNGKGCCVSESCCFAYLAKECGYTAYVCDNTGHAWVEINGLVYDTLFAEGENYNKYYASTYSTVRFTKINATAV